MQEIKLKTHLIVTDVHEEYHIKWTGHLKDTRPYLKNGLPVFIIVGADGRMELNTIDMQLIEHCAKNLTHPRGRGAFSTDSAYIYILEEDEKETLMGTVIHDHIKQYQQMYDTFKKF